MIAEARVEDLALGAVPVVGLARVRGKQHAARRQALRDLDRAAAFGHAGADGAAELNAASGEPGTTRRVRTEMTPPNASDP